MLKIHEFEFSFFQFDVVNVRDKVTLEKLVYSKVFNLSLKFCNWIETQ